MPARKPKPRPKEPTGRGAKPQKLMKVGVAPVLSAREVRELRARAAADLRTLCNHASHLVVESLSRKHHGPAANRNVNRKPFWLRLYLTAAERKRLEARAKAERRSLSSYVARVIAAELA